jgi:ATP-dependent exoDNAse (exonuclease V) beta subunit
MSQVAINFIEAPPYGCAIWLCFRRGTVNHPQRAPQIGGRQEPRAQDDEIIPSQTRIENVADDADLEEVYDSERHLLYVACTRARDHLLVTGVKPAFERFANGEGHTRYA